MHAKIDISNSLVLYHQYYSFSTINTGSSNLLLYTDDIPRI